jgi:hypothetical protein
MKQSTGEEGTMEDDESKRQDGRIAEGHSDAWSVAAHARELAGHARMLARTRLDVATEVQREILACAASEIAHAALRLAEHFGGAGQGQGEAETKPSALNDPRSESRPPATTVRTVSDVTTVQRSDGVLERLLVEPHTLATVAASARACDHPRRMGVAFEATVDRVTTRTVWCAACGAMGYVNDEEDLRWIRPSVVSLVTRSLLLEVEQVAASLGEIERAIGFLGDVSCPCAALAVGNNERELAYRKSVAAIAAAVSEVAKRAAVQAERVGPAMVALGDTVPPPFTGW